MPEGFGGPIDRIEGVTGGAWRPSCRIYTLETKTTSDFRRSERKLSHPKDTPPKFNRARCKIFLPSTKCSPIDICLQKNYVLPEPDFVLKIRFVFFLIFTVSTQITPKWSGESMQIFVPHARVYLSNAFDRILLSVLIAKFF